RFRHRAPRTSCLSLVVSGIDATGHAATLAGSYEPHWPALPDFSEIEDMVDVEFHGHGVDAEVAVLEGPMNGYTILIRDPRAPQGCQVHYVGLLSEENPTNSLLGMRVRAQNRDHGIQPGD